MEELNFNKEDIARENEDFCLLKKGKENAR